MNVYTFKHIESPFGENDVIGSCVGEKWIIKTYRHFGSPHDNLLPTSIHTAPFYWSMRGLQDSNAKFVICDVLLK
jgi:hypothetical protein